uniref:Uncharacterized protein n=1 Tax=Ditylenchus dipsaci TaxID=166011 RepID=A0A915DVG2_9BILA
MVPRETVLFFVQSPCLINLYFTDGILPFPLALSATFYIPMFLAILLTAFISAIYLLTGGARAAIFTSALQMLTIIGSLLIICVASFVHWDWNVLYENARNGARINFSDFRLDPRVRHSVFPLLIGGSCMIFSLYATNQLTIQRYMALPTLKKAQQVVLLTFC